jgi:phosphopantothenoylcysteine decarboxylase/phosphopantothenate--cysteine ligase
MDSEIAILKGRHIVIGVTGGIAAYKAADLTSRLVKAGAQVEVVMTPAAAEFVRPITFQALTHRPVAMDMFALLQETEIGHVSLGKRAELMIIAPATANTLAKLAHGFADDLLTTLCLATTAPLTVAPAMNHRMWLHPATQANIATLRARGAQVVGPEDGPLAEGESGPGRLSEPAAIVAAVVAATRASAGAA